MFSLGVNSCNFIKHNFFSQLHIFGTFGLCFSIGKLVFNFYQKQMLFLKKHTSQHPLAFTLAYISIVDKSTSREVTNCATVSNLAETVVGRKISSSLISLGNHQACCLACVGGAISGKVEFVGAKWTPQQ